jgi:[ribosomal protein S18]-alanine N-acetyltransferase
MNAVRSVPAVLSVRFRMMQVSDLDAVVAIEHARYAFPWSRNILADCLNNHHACWVMEQAGEVVGYCIMSVVLDEAHLMNFCVAASVAGQGYGRRMLQRTFDIARWHRAESLFLEVRSSNATARHLYLSAGFEELGRRRNYYPAPNNGREDAIVMRKSLTGC